MHRYLIALLIGLACALPVLAEDGPAVWRGNGVVTGGKGYATTPMGQVHYRDVGPRDTAAPFLLLHQSPMSMIEFAETKNAMAAQGYRAIAVDTPGFGMSDMPKGTPGIADFADNLVPLLDALKIKKVTLGGHHTGASIAVAFAARHPDRVAAVVIHGVPYYNAEERAERLKRPIAERPLKSDGSHLSEYFKYALHRGPGDPTAFENMRNATWSTINFHLYEHDVGHGAVFIYEMESDLKKISAPTLVLTDAKDPLHNNDLRATKLRPEFTLQEFSQTGMMSTMNEPKRWADIAVAFAKAHPAK